MTGIIIWGGLFVGVAAALWWWYGRKPPPDMP
jgi:hypothetical protein